VTAFNRFASSLEVLSSEGDPTEELLKACADSVRLRILRALRHDSFSVSELCVILEMKQPAVSHHLKLLLGAGLVAIRREGTITFYRRVWPAVADSVRADLVRALFSAFDARPLDASLSDQIEEIKRLRSRDARDFFNRHSREFTKTQELIALPGQYLPTVQEMLERSCWGRARAEIGINEPLAKGRAVLEIGAGRGELISPLLDLFHSVYVVDVSEEMIELTCRAIPAGERERVTIIHGDTGVAVATGITVSHVVCAMVLHHVPSPADIFRDCAELLEPGGSVIVADLCRHNQSWAIERCGDMWMGFDPMELEGFATHAGLVAGDQAFFALRNGFQIQVRRFDKISV
jgi:ArsR family transcriptional regulator